MGRTAVLEGFYPMTSPLPAFGAYGRREAQAKTAMGGLGDAAGV